MSWRDIVGFCLLVTAALASGWWLTRLQAPPSPPLLTADSRVGHYFRGATIVDSGPDGKALYQLSARQILHYPGDDSVALEEVSVVYRSTGDSSWTLSADRGRILDAGELIELEGNVRLVNISPADPVPTTITTDLVHYRPRQQLASSENRVVIRYHGERVAGTGMRAYLQEDRVELQSNIDGLFIP